jgi:hypothetical protein
MFKTVKKLQSDVRHLRNEVMELREQLQGTAVDLRSRVRELDIDLARHNQERPHGTGQRTVKLSHVDAPNQKVDVLIEEVVTAVADLLDLAWLPSQPDEIVRLKGKDK